MCNEDALIFGRKTLSKVAIATTVIPPDIQTGAEKTNRKGRTTACDCFVRYRFTPLAVCSIAALSRFGLKRALPVKLALFCLSILFVGQVGFAADHSPLFSYATPVNAEREFSFNTGVFGRGGSAGTQLSTGTGFGYGLKPHLTLSASLPAMVGSGNLPENRIVSGSEWAAGVSWRFVDSINSVSRRLESTASLNVVEPGPQSPTGLLGELHRAPGVAGVVATGLASRSQYLWLGSGYTRFAEASRDRRPDTISWSAAYGYRPSNLRRGVDQWDYRGFAELTGEHTGNVLRSGAVIPGSRSTTLWLGPSVLAIFKEFAIGAGVQGPIFRDVSENMYGRERIRFGINLSYLRYSGGASR